jgi:uncharacterized membrane protein
VKYKKIIEIAGVTVLCVCVIGAIAFTAYTYLENNLSGNNTHKNVTSKKSVSNSHKKKNSNKKVISKAKTEDKNKDVAQDLSSELINKIGKGDAITGNVK